jgi:hypothetical protein
MLNTIFDLQSSAKGQKNNIYKLVNGTFEVSSVNSGRNSFIKSTPGASRWSDRASIQVRIVGDHGLKF